MSRVDEIEARVGALLRASAANNHHQMVTARTKILDHAVEDVGMLLARLRALEAGLAWYAELDNYLGHCPEALDDRGTRARTALAANEG